uniref:Uncharacterized protein n=1 Tax=Rhizophora mucronata TaxID=61149 RepID=A0A2P2IPA7_RHIMU
MRRKEWIITQMSVCC